VKPATKLVRLVRVFGAAAPLAGACLLGAVGAPTTTGCQTHECDPDIVCIDVTGMEKIVPNAAACTPPDGGSLVAEGPGWTPVPNYNTNVNVNGNTLTWTTSSLSGPWLDYPGNRTYIINFPPPFGTAAVLPPYPVLSADNPLDASPHDNFISGLGYLGEFTNLTNQQVTVNNASCAHYFLLIEVTAELSAEAGASGADVSNGIDAGDAPDASPSDATADSADAGSAD
jgi:hypothetical protein